MHISGGSRIYSGTARVLLAIVDLYFCAGNYIIDYAVPYEFHQTLFHPLQKKQSVKSENKLSLRIIISHRY